MSMRANIDTFGRSQEMHLQVRGEGRLGPRLPAATDAPAGEGAMGEETAAAAPCCTPRCCFCCCCSHRQRERELCGKLDAANDRCSSLTVRRRGPSVLSTT